MQGVLDADTSSRLLQQMTTYAALLARLVQMAASALIGAQMQAASWALTWAAHEGKEDHTADARTPGQTT